MIPDNLNLNFWYYIFMTPLTVFYRAWYNVVHILRSLPKISKVQCVAFAGHALFYV